MPAHVPARREAIMKQLQEVKELLQEGTKCCGEVMEVIQTEYHEELPQEKEAVTYNTPAYYCHKCGAKLINIDVAILVEEMREYTGEYKMDFNEFESILQTATI